MSYDQSYDVPSFQELLEKLAGISGTQLLIDHLEGRGIKITNLEDVILTEGMYECVKGVKVRLSDGRVFVPKLVEQYTQDGNYGRDTYAWFLVGDTPEVKHVSQEEEFANEHADPVEDEAISHGWEG